MTESSSEQQPKKSAKQVPTTATTSPKVSTSNSSNSSSAKTARVRSSKLPWLNLGLIVLTVIATSFLGLFGWQSLQQKIQVEIVVLQDRLNQNQQDLIAMQQRNDELLSQASQLTESSSNFAKQIEFNSDRLSKLPGAERQDWLLAEVEYLLRLANQRLNLERDWDSSLSMLIAADNVLLETRNPRFNPVRQIIANEIIALRAVPLVDHIGAVLRLQALQQQISDLEWLPQQVEFEPVDVSEVTLSAAAEQDASDQAPSVTATGYSSSTLKSVYSNSLATIDQWWQISLTKAKENLSNLIRIRQLDKDLPPPLTPDQRYYLQQNMFLMLEQAQIALLREQTELYQHSLERVSDWINQYVVLDNVQSIAIQTSLQELQKWDVAPKKPDISQSLQRLQQLLEQQRRGTVVSSVSQLSASESDL